MSNRRFTLIAVAATALLSTSLVVFSQNAKAPAGESERKVKESEVPKAALEALKKLAGAAAITEFSEEIEHGSKFYEGSWAGPSGNIDALVTEAGDLVEIEETIPADKAPAGVRAAAEKEAGKDAKISYEKKTMVLYEVHFKKDGKGREVIITPDGRTHREGGDPHRDSDEEGDEDEDD